ncbi:MULTISPECIES: hypothetical protein [unclassified Pseudomonas]|jgi:Flp pilus assembly pilin Flp|uniref:hypothetical protein n=1 Tax=unclassified Pseudomonas TaxID=196821 RepID=UPI002447A929|nr:MULTISPECIES: hypothetical protein [unclassified Pseudomonas]MDG9924872.1 hypothetical protein [Pseudomonas sp. GD04045]MDH0036153.1 hypothetical protein [Pseudomonas sp. GD04019]
MNIKARARQLGQGMTEYIIIVALIAIAAIVVYNLFGDTVRGQVGDMAAELSGGAADHSAAAKATAAQGQDQVQYELGNFDQVEEQ